MNTLTDYSVYFRCFRGPGYWGHFKNTKAFSAEHAQRKLDRIRSGYVRKHGITGEFRIDPGFRR